MLPGRDFFNFRCVWQCAADSRSCSRDICAWKAAPDCFLVLWPARGVARKWKHIGTGDAERVETFVPRAPSTERPFHRRSFFYQAHPPDVLFWHNVDCSQLICDTVDSLIELITITEVDVDEVCIRYLYSRCLRTGTSRQSTRSMVSGELCR